MQISVRLYRFSEGIVGNVWQEFRAIACTSAQSTSGALEPSSQQTVDAALLCRERAAVPGIPSLTENVKGRQPGILKCGPRGSVYSLANGETEQTWSTMAERPGACPARTAQGAQGERTVQMAGGSQPGPPPFPQGTGGFRSLHRLPEPGCGARSHSLPRLHQEASGTEHWALRVAFGEWEGLKSGNCRG